ncbi:MAG TPA: hypothetical protein VFQ17_14440 [Nocardioides sp.]|jgi:hypothetical protein|nr:hypothetical protein [Nocardioides sp.]
MNIIDTATVTALIAVVAFAVLVVLLAAGIGLGHVYAGHRPARAARPAARVLRGRYAH